MSGIQSNKVVTGKCRLSYCHLFTPDTGMDGGDPKYSVSIIIPKSDKKTLAKIDKAIKAAIAAGESKLAGKSGKVNVNAVRTPLRDGDIDREDDAAYEDSYFINASSKNKPGVVDEDLEPVIDQSEVYSGCFGRVSLNFFAYNSNGNKGIGAGLNNVQKLADGEPLGSVSNPEDDFAEEYKDDFDDDDLI